MNTLESYLPSNTPLALPKIKELRRAYGMSYVEAKKSLLARHKRDAKEGLQNALADYKLAPSEFGEEFLADILSELVGMI